MRAGNIGVALSSSVSERCLLAVIEWFDLTPPLQGVRVCCDKDPFKPAPVRRGGSGVVVGGWFGCGRWWLVRV